MKLLSIAACAAIVHSAVAQAQAPTAPTTRPTPSVVLRAAYEAHRDHQRYTFENPSNIDTSFLVPHSFTQSYVANNHWLAISLKYPVGTYRMETEFAVTPERQTAGSDFDTFHDPNDDVVVSGTAGDVLMRSFRFIHWSEERWWGLPWRVGYIFRRDRAQFLPTDRILTHSNPPSEVRSQTFGRETTYSQVHEIPIEVLKPVLESTKWTLTVGADLSPLVWARLVTILPDKYPGQNIVADAKALGAGGRIELVRQTGKWPIVLRLHYGRTWSYSSARQFKRDSLQASIGVDFER